MNDTIRQSQLPAFKALTSPSCLLKVVESALFMHAYSQQDLDGGNYNHCGLSFGGRRQCCSLVPDHDLMPNFFSPLTEASAL